MKNGLRENIKTAFRLTLPVLAGYVFLGVTFGLVAIESGLPWWVPPLMSIAIYSGALEFAAVPVLVSAFDPIGAFLLSLTLSARHLFYGIPMLRRYEKTGKIKPFLIFGLTDETFSLLSAASVPEGSSPRDFYFSVTLFDYLYWITGTVAGAVLGTALKFDLEGLDFALTALFVVLFIEQIKTKTGLRSGIAGLLASAAALAVFGSNGFVIGAMLFITVILVGGRRVLEHE